MFFFKRETIEKKANQITFEVESLKKPWRRLSEKSVKKIVKKFSPKTVVWYNQSQNKKLVYKGSHPFLMGMYHAYNDHRPFVLSPDMIWLLIAQGFGSHVLASKETLQPLITPFTGKRTLKLETEDYLLSKSASSWEVLFPQFMEQLKEHTKKDIVQNLVADFSTTSLVEKIVSQITIMGIMQPYFEYTVSGSSCGIPELTIEGTENDWQKIIQKVEYLSQFELDWWTERLLPILYKIKETIKGNIDLEFWQSMFKVHTSKWCGRPKYIDGWIANFFPYSRNGQRRNLNQIPLKRINWLPPEQLMISFDYELINENGQVIKVFPMELMSGFIGLQQNASTLALRPEIGWSIGHKHIPNPTFDKKHQGSISFANQHQFPIELLEYKDIKSVSIHFQDKVHIPEEIKDKRFVWLGLYGKVSDKEIDRIRKLVNTRILKINGVSYEPIED